MAEKEGKGWKGKEKDGLHSFLGLLQKGFLGKKRAPEVEKKGGGEGPITAAVMKLQLHCEGCALKLQTFAMRLEGVKIVSTELSTGEMVVVGKIDPYKIREILQAERGRNVELISPDGDGMTAAILKLTLHSEGCAAEAEEFVKGIDGVQIASTDLSTGGLVVAISPQGAPAAGNEKKGGSSSTVVSSTVVVLMMSLHCEGLNQRIKKTMEEMEGVETVSLDEAKNLVNVEGTMDLKDLPAVLKELAAAMGSGYDGGDGAQTPAPSCETCGR